MNFGTLHDYCLQKKGVTAEFPFDEHTLVFKVMGKMYALVGMKREPLSVNLKCDPERALELRATYEAVQPGYHMNKTHWNTVQLNHDLEDRDLRDLIDHSYALVVRSLKKADRAALNAL